MAEAIVDGRGSGNYLAVDENNAMHTKTLDSAGNVVSPSVLDGYLPVQTDLSNASNQFFGFEAPAGKWYMMNQSGAAATVKDLRYMAGSTDFGTNWTNRGSLLTAGSFTTPGSVTW